MGQTRVAVVLACDEVPEPVCRGSERFHTVTAREVLVIGFVVRLVGEMAIVLKQGRLARIANPCSS